MVAIVGLVENSAGAVIANGRIGVQLRQIMIDRASTPDGVLTTEPAQYTITNGILNSPALPGTTLGQIDLPTTATLAVSYRFTIEKAIGTTTWYLDTGAEYPDDAPRVQQAGVWYTGASFVAGESKRITPTVRFTYESIVDPFDAIIPDVPTIELADLLQLAADFVSNPQAGLAYLAQLLSSDPQYADKLRLGRWLGIYNPATTYFRGDVVSFGSPAQAWVWKLSSAGSGVAPPASGQTGNANWDYFPNINVNAPAVDLTNYLLRTGGTMTGNLVLPAPGASPPNTLALRQAEADGYYVRTSPVAQSIGGNKDFTGTLTVPNQAIADATTKAANTAFVNNYWLGNRYERLLVSAGRGANQSLTFNVMNKITWDQIFVNINEGNGLTLDANGVFTIRTAGWYRIFVVVESTSAGGSAGGILQMRQTTAPATNFKLMQFRTDQGTVIMNGTTLANFVGGAQFEIQYQPAYGATPYNIVGDVNTTRIFVFRQLL